MFFLLLFSILTPQNDKKKINLKLKEPILFQKHGWIAMLNGVEESQTIKTKEKEKGNKEEF